MTALNLSAVGLERSRTSATAENRPTDLLRHGLLANAAETIHIAFGILVVAWLFGYLTWHVVLFASAVAYSAVFHRLQHLPREQVCTAVRILQRMKILQDWRRRGTLFEPIKPVPPMTTIFMGSSSLIDRWDPRMGEGR